MKTPDIAKQMARQAGVSPAEAADRLNGAVRQLLTDLRRRREPELPGLGRFRRDRGGELVFVPTSKGNRHD